MTAPLASLLVSRFSEHGGGRALDLATGRAVAIIRRQLDPVGKDAWPIALSRIARLWHPAIAPCVDFGWTATGEWFEAYAIEGSELLSPTAQMFLSSEAADCSLVRLEPGRRTGPLVPSLPDDDRRIGAARGAPARGIGLRLVARSLEDPIVCALGEGRLGGPIVWSIDAPYGSGWRTTWRRLARAARQAGYVPIDHAVLEMPLGDRHAGSWLGALAGAALVVTVEQEAWHAARRGHLARLLVRLGGLDATSIVVLDVVRGGRPVAAPHRLAPIEPDALAAALWVPPGCSPHWLRARRTAELTGGMPGPFVDAIAERLGLRPPSSTVHERPAGFDRGTAGEPVCRASEAMRRAAALVGRGRAAAADRHLAKTAHALRRRGEAEGRAAVLAVRAELLAARGEVRRSRLVWQEAAGLNGEPASALMDPAGRLAAEWLRHGAIREAEQLLISVAAAAQILDRAVPATLNVALATARCWQARWHEALQTDERVGEARVGQVWPSLELGDLDAAIEHLRAARVSPATVDQRWLDVAEARLDIALGAVDRLHERAARAAPTLAVDLLGDELAVLPFEGLARLGVPLTPDMRRQLRWLMRPSAPRLLRARARLVLALDGWREPPASVVEEVARVARATGARALAHGESRLSCWRRVLPEATPMVNDLVAVLQTCQTDDDPRVALAHVVRLVHDRLRADGVAVVGRGSGGDVVLARIGDHDLGPRARRAMDVASPVVDCGVGWSEAAVPVKLGSVVTGALGAKWLMPSGAPASDTLALVEAVATAVAPTVRLAVEVAPRIEVPTLASALVGVSPAIARVRSAVEVAARAPFRVLVEGESGSGKELVAREIHRLSSRRARAFCAINCAALTDELCESELFGHARGAFTGALAERAGLFEEADGGTLFLDEVGELSPRAQAKLLRVLQEGEIRRLGETRPRRVDVRLVAATNRPLIEAVGVGAFRADLRYRLDVIHITVPPLRERTEDIPLLAQQVWQRATERVGSRAHLAADTVAALARYDWPGNVRELQNVLSALAAGAPPRGVVRASALPAELGGDCRTPPGVTLEQARRMTDERVVREALAHAGGHRGRAARALGVTRQGLAKLVDRLQIETTYPRLPSA